MEDIKSSKHLTDIILTRTSNVPNYALLLGAGASSSSGINTAEDMIVEWRRQLYGQTSTGESFDKWLSGKEWYQSDEEYSFLFGTIYDEASQRRDYIEECIDGSHPNWGYLYLAGLLEDHVIDTVLTTNFDDLVNEACYLYTNKERPIVCAHDSQVSNLSIRRKRTKIVKMHGDFLFDNIKNLSSETTSLETNMKDKFVQFGQEYGLVVIGYGGRDESVMSIIEELVNKEGHFKHGVYWCLLKDETPAKRVQELIKHKGVHAIEIDGFDEFMALLSKQAHLELSPMLINPKLVAEQRSRVFCSVPKRLQANTIIKGDIDRLKAVYKTSVETPGTKELASSEDIPYSLRAVLLKEEGDIDGALASMKLAVNEDKEDKECAWEYANMLAQLDRTTELKDFVDDSALRDEDKVYFRLYYHDDEGLLKYVSEKLLNDPNNIFHRINKAIALKRLKKTEELTEDLDILEGLKPSISIMAGVESLRGRKKDMLSHLDTVLTRKLLTKEDMMEFPVFEDYREDEEFKRFIAEWEEKQE